MSRKNNLLIKLIIIFLFAGASSLFAQHGSSSVIRGTIRSDKGPLDFATVYLKNTQISTNSDSNGNFILRIPPGQHTLCVRYVGYMTYEKQIEVKPQEELVLHIQMKGDNRNL